MPEIYLPSFLTACFVFSYRYRPTLTVSYVSQTLAFDSEEDCLAFLDGVEAVLDGSRSNIDCKLSLAKLNASPST